MRVGIVRAPGVESPLDRGTLIRIVRKVLGAEGLRPSDPWEVAVSLIESDRMRETNRRWRGMDRVTDVVSFAAGEGEGGAYAGFFLGDIVIAPAVGAAHARRYRPTPEREMARVLGPGLLHLLGYDHDTVTRRRIMRQREKEALASLFPRRGRDAA